jgi:hypothetical protein
VNRTFGAFGILLSLLVLATLGVSSSSRSTQVRVISTKTIAKQTRRCGGGTFVFVLPETAPSGEPRCIATVQIELADSGGADRPLDEIDCGPRGDAAFDYTVHGDLSPAATSHTGQTPAVELHGMLNAEELVGIFNTLQRGGQRNRSSTSSLRAWFVSSSGPCLLGFKNWAVRELERLPLSWIVTGLANRQAPIVPAITWADYSSFADRVVRTPPRPQPARVERAAAALQGQGRVQSGHWLLHSAASSLNHLALVLQAAADRLEQPVELATAH